MDVIFEDLNGLDPEIIEKMKAAAELLMQDHGIENEALEVSVTIVGAEEIRELNDRFREIDAVTDVLSFPQFDDPQEIPSAGPALLGDVVICLDTAEQQAAEYGHSAARELVYLFVHSILHLLGYDHMDEEEKAEMRRAEEAVMERLELTRESEPVHTES